MRKRSIYLDFNGSTPVHPEVLHSYVETTRSTWGNASAAHPLGQRAQAAIEHARRAIARALGAAPEELWFTSGGTESNNWAVKGSLPRSGRGHVLVSAVEHKSVLRSAEALARRGVEVEVLPVGPSGALEVAAIERALRPDTVLVSLMLANNETGVLQPVREVAALCRARGVRMHCDAVAAIGKLAVNVAELGCDLLSISGHKLYAPKGCGLLYVRRGVVLEPLIDGCGQQCGMRSGTENTPAVVALGRAFELLAAGEFAAARSSELRDRLWRHIRELAPEAQRNGAGPWLPNTLNVAFPGHSGAQLLAELGAQGVSCSAGAAAAGSAPSHVLLAMGLSEERARSSLRFTLGCNTTAAEIEDAAQALARALRSCRTQPQAQSAAT